MPRLQLLNCFWLLLPIFAWNTIFASRLPQQVSSRTPACHTILTAENVLRIAVFLWPLLLPLRWQDPAEPGRAGRVCAGRPRLFCILAAVDLSLRLECRLEPKCARLLAPAYTPLICAGRHVLVGRIVAVCAAIFAVCGLHVYHNIRPRLA